MKQEFVCVTPEIPKIARWFSSWTPLYPQSVNST